MLCVGRSVHSKRQHGSTQCVLFADSEEWKEVSRFKMVHNNFLSKEEAAPSHRHVRAFLWSLWHALNWCFEHQCICKYVRYTGVSDVSATVRVCKDTLHTVCTCTRVCAVCYLALEDYCRGFSSYRALVAGMRCYF